MILRSLAGRCFKQILITLLILCNYYILNLLFLYICRYSGFYKGIQSAGAAVAWQVDAHKVSFMSQLIVNWVLTTISYPLLLVLVALAVKEEDNNNNKAVKEEAITQAASSSISAHNGNIAQL